MLNINILESYMRLLDRGQADLDLNAEYREHTWIILRRTIDTAINFGHVSRDGTVDRWTLYRLADRDDVNEGMYRIALGRAKQIIENI